MSVYLGYWETGGFRAMVADFEEVYLYDDGRTDETLAGIMALPTWAGVEVILASYGCANYSGDAFVLFRKDGQLYEVNAGHCSCSGLERQWCPEPTTVDALRHRMEHGKLGSDDYSENVFVNELRAALDAIEPAP